MVKHTPHEVLVNGARDFNEDAAKTREALQKMLKHIDSHLKSYFAHQQQLHNKARALVGPAFDLALSQKYVPTKELTPALVEKFVNRIVQTSGNKLAENHARIAQIKEQAVQVGLFKKTSSVVSEKPSSTSGAPRPGRSQPGKG